MMNLTLESPKAAGRPLDPPRSRPAVARPAAPPDPADLPPDERELMLAMLAYKDRSGRMFPTWSEVLEVLVELGYRKDESSSPQP